MANNGGAGQFEGFDAPRYTQVPDQIFDELLPSLSGAELKVLLYIVRRTFGFKKDSDAISLAQLTHGITTKDGRTLDQGTGLSRAAVINAVKILVERGVILATPNRSRDKGSQPTTFQLHLRSPGSINWTPPGLENGLVPVQKLDPQETVLQETESQETDSTKLRRATTQADLSTEDAAARDLIAAYVADYGGELHDEAPVQSSTTRALDLFRRSGLSLEDFRATMVTAKQETQRQSATIRKASSKGGRLRVKNKIPYWFGTIEKMLVLRASAS